MNGINLVTLHNIPDHVHNKLPGFAVTRIKILFIAIGKELFRMDSGDMSGSNTGCVHIEIGAIGIQPGM